MRSLLYFLFVLIVGACHAVPDRGTVAGAPSQRHAPVTVAYSGDPDYSEAVKGAVEWWNDQLDFPALILVDATAPDVLVMDAPLAGTREGSADPRRGLVFLHRPGDGYKAWLVTCHELGHAAFWLLDDPDHGYSIMAGDLVNYDPWSPPVKAYGLTPGDRARIRVQFGRAP